MTGMVVGIDEVDFEYSIDGQTSWAELPGAKNVFIPETTTEWRDRTTTEVKDRHKRYGRGMKDTGEGAINCFASPELFDLVEAMEAVADKDGVSFRVKFKPSETQLTGDIFTYKAHVEMSLGGENEIEADAMCSLKLRPSGGVARTKGDPKP